MTDHLRELARSVHDFLREYYSLDSSVNPDLSDFILASRDDLVTGGEVLVHEAEDGIELGIQFGSELERTLCRSVFSPPPHLLGVVTEEVSHFLAIMQAATQDSRLSQLDLEVLGEIDRFLIFLHARPVLERAGFGSGQNWANDTTSLASLCHMVFESRHFLCKPELLGTYLKAETIALSHLRKAFENRWNDSSCNRSRCDSSARSYLIALHRAVTGEGHSVRIFLECA